MAHYPGVVASDDPTDRVRGVLIKLKNPCRVFPELDAYEGVPDLYTREPAPITKGDRKQVLAWIYIYNRPVDRLPLIPSGDFRKPFSQL